MFLLVHEQGAVWAVALESSMAAEAAAAAANMATFIESNWWWCNLCDLVFGGCTSVDG